MSENNEEPRGILCGKGHRHATVAAVKACYESEANASVSWDTPSGQPRVAPKPPALAPRAPHAPSVAGSDGRRVVHTSAPMTEAQGATIKRLGGTVSDGMTRLQASQRIDSLLEAQAERERRLEADGGRVETVEEEKQLHATTLGLPAEMLFGIRPGRFAVSTDGSNRLDFVRVMHIKAKPGKYVRYAGFMKIQTQHGDMLKDRAVVSPKGEVVITSNSMDATKLTAILMGIIIDQRAANIKYGREKGMCCRCGKTLTDERSRYYGIGPECEKSWPEIVDEVNENEGEFTPSEALI